jgi:hypothetical protein
MPFTPPDNLALAFNLEKEARIIDFIATHATRECRLLARSPQSPVVKALSSVSARLVNPLALRVIFTRFASDADLKDSTSPPLFSGEVQYRMLGDVRYLDAHEQLILDDSALWVGDCMRRDPVKRDSFESFSVSDPVSLRNARISFERLWSAGQGVHERLAVLSHDVAGALFPVAGDIQPEPKLRPRV